MTLARSLLAAVLAAWPELAQAGRKDVLEAALEAIDRFVAAPGPASYLAARRVLAAARRSARAAALGQALAARSFARGLDELRTLGLVDGDTVALLSSLPVDLRAGRRLSALAALLGAHHELAGRVREVEAQRAPVQLPPSPSPSPPCTRARRRRAPRRARLRARRRLQ